MVLQRQIGDPETSYFVGMPFREDTAEAVDQVLADLGVEALPGGEELSVRSVGDEVASYGDWFLLDGDGNVFIASGPAISLFYEEVPT